MYLFWFKINLQYRDNINFKEEVILTTQTLVKKILYRTKSFPTSDAIQPSLST